MAGPRHPVSVHATALVQTERLQVRSGHCQPQKEIGREGGNSWVSPSQVPHSFFQQTFAFSVRWSDNSNTFVRRSCDEFRRLHVSEPGVTLTSYN